MAGVRFALLCVLIAVTCPAAETPQTLFDVREYRVLGNTQLPVREIETVLYPLLGDGKSLTDVEVARAALEKTYHDHGFGTVFVDIVPGQDVSDGVVRLRATEGRLHETTISGARYFPERDIAAAVPAAQAGTVPNLQALQDQIAAVNAQTADRSVVPILKAGPVPGTVDLSLKVNDHLPLHGSVELNNAYSAETEPLRANLGLSYSNLFADLDTLAAQYQFSPQRPGQVSVIAANYLAHPIFGGLRLSASFIDSNSAVSTIGGLDVLGKGQIAGLRLAVPVQSNAATIQTLTLGLDYKHFRQTVNLGSGTALDTPISYVNLSLGYGGTWIAGPNHAVLNLSANFGPRGINANADGFENDRYLARPNYFYLRGDGSWVQSLPAQWQVLARVSGQWAREPLVSNEDYSLTGFDGVRGYLEAEVLADAAIRGTLQLQSPPLKWRIDHLADAFVFFDAGHAYLLQPLPGEAGTFSASSYGAGFDLLPGHTVSGSLSWAMPLSSASNTEAHSSRLLFVVRGAF